MFVACVQKYLLYSQNSASNCVSIFGNTFCDFFNLILYHSSRTTAAMASSPTSACKLALFLLLSAIKIDKYLEWILECKRSSFAVEKTPWNDHFKLGNKTLRARFLVVFPLLQLLVLTGMRSTKRQTRRSLTICKSRDIYLLDVIRFQKTISICNSCPENDRLWSKRPTLLPKNQYITTCCSLRYCLHPNLLLCVIISTIWVCA